MTGARVMAVCRRSGHHFSKDPQLSIMLVAGHGVSGDGHFGTKVKHRSRVLRDRNAPNLRQVHLLQSELFDDLAEKGFQVMPGDLGENITTRNADILAMPTGTCLHIGSSVLQLTGLRNPCLQLDRFSQGLMAATLDRALDNSLVRRAGVMGVVLFGGTVRPGDSIIAILPVGEARPLLPV